jgi:hypothetical protein
MKRIITFLFVIGAFAFNNLSFAQSTASPDTVCAGSTQIYDVNPTAGSTYNWRMKGGTSFGTITTVAGRTDSISVTYSATTGTDTLLLVEIGPTGCSSDTVKLAVIKLPAISVALSGTDSICINSASVAQLSLTFTGAAPYNVTYTDGTTPVSITTSLNPYLITTPVYTTAGIFPYSIVSATGVGSCPANTSGTGSVSVFPKPSPGAIQHY